MSSSAANQPLKVLIHVHPSVDTLDFTAPLEILSHATFSPGGARVFTIDITSGTEYTTTGQNLIVKRHISLVEAYERLSAYDILLIPGGASPEVLTHKTEPLNLIRAFYTLPPPSPPPSPSPSPNQHPRTILSVCTGSLFLAEAGVLDGLTATTHAFYYDKLREILASKEGGEGTKVVEERFVVNQPSRGQEEGGAGTVRVITSGGVSCGMDSSLWLVGDVAGKESLERVADLIQYRWREGVVL